MARLLTKEALVTMIRVTPTSYTVGLSGTNPRVATILGDQPEADREAFALLSFEMGVELRALGSANGTVIALGDQLKSAAQATSSSITSVADGLNKSMLEGYNRYLGQDGVFNKTMMTAMDAFVKSLDPTTGAAARKMFDQLKAESTKAAAAMVTEVGKNLNVNDPKSPFGTLHRDNAALKGAIEKLQEQFAAQVRVDAVKIRTPLKGGSLETWVGSVLTPVSAARGESFDRCANTQGAIARCMTGDFISTVDGAHTGGQDATVVTEAKNEEKSIGGLRAVLTRARQNRGARAALGVISNPKLIADPIAIYDKVHVIVSLPDFGKPDADYPAYETLLANGLTIARLIAIAAVESPVAETVDLDRIKRLVDQLAATSKLRSQLKGDVTRSITAAQKVQTTTEELDMILDGITKSLRDTLADEYKKIAAAAHEGIAPLKLATTVLDGPMTNGSGSTMRS
jgi:hypothetical protein